MNELAEHELEAIAQATFRKTVAISLKHARLNRRFVKRTVADLPPQPGSPAIVVSGGPSIHLRKPLDVLARRGFSGQVIACDGALGNCLRHGIVPDYVVCVDPHPDRIVRWFGDTKLAQRPADDYFKNQDLDEALRANELKANEEMIRLVNASGPRIKAILATGISPDIPERCLEAGMEIYWWNPIVDDTDKEDSATRELYRINPAPCLVTGGNVGASSWAFAYAVLRKKVIGLLGMDFSYAPGTPLHRTQYYEHIKELYPNDPERAFIKIFNPHLNETWFTDPAYYWYRQSFLTMVQDIEPDVEVHNCSEGGVLFGRNIRFTPFERFLGTHG